MNCIRALALSVGILAVFPAVAAPIAEVVALQMPAWVKGDGRQRPLEAGMVLTQNEVIRTGIAARVLVQFADGGVLKLGEQARITLAKAGMSSESKTLSRIMLVVRRGAFSFTTMPAKGYLPHDVSMNLGGTNIRIRRGNIWGRVGRHSAIFCLIRGHVTVRNPAAGRLDMDKPMTVFRIPRALQPELVRPVDPQRLKVWSAQTEVTSGQGLTVPNGVWIVQLVAQTRRRDLYPMQRRLVTAGYPVKLSSARINGRTFFRLRIKGFGSKADAHAFADRIRGHYDITAPWLARGRGRSI